MAKGQGKSKSGVAERVERLLAPTIEELGYELWDLVFEKEGPDWFLRITIDSENGITIDDCERVNRAVDPILDEADPIESSYNLEVSSPGIERELRIPRHIEAFAGTDERVEVRFFAPKDGKKKITGRIDSYDADSDSLTIACDEGTAVTFPRSECALIKTVFDFGS